ncbi:MAG TPA: hypothetical protein VMK83_10000 [Gaiellaceae bacterium]|nr:hypothetical protein [Gaiellaceae bacterium]
MSWRSIALHTRTATLDEASDTGGPDPSDVSSALALLRVERENPRQLVFELLLQRLELAERLLRTCFLAGTEIAARDLRPDTLLRRLNLADPGNPLGSGYRIAR